MDTLIEKIRAGDRRSLARAMSLVDNANDASRALKDRLRQLTGKVPWWGFTGPPGVGKSTLIDALITALRERQRRVGVVAVDPTSPLSDGALLGDRVRMMRHALDPDVFIRSLATHHCAGGLSDATLHCARLLELAGYDPVLIETVGVGQSETDIAAVADIRVVMLGPGYGDDIQLIKAGLLEIADLIVINKCDLPEANRLLQEVHEEFTQTSAARADRPAAQADNRATVEIIGIEAKSGRGVDQLLTKLLAADEAARNPEQQKRNQQRRVLGEIKRGALLVCEQALARGLADSAGLDLVAKLQSGELALDDVVNKQLSRISDKARHSPPTPDN
ncbi:MAG: methylmalonyl Co-A mutase-associated GTPase MeaB [Planctomycetota bacterium]